MNQQTQPQQTPAQPPVANPEPKTCLGCGAKHLPKEDGSLPCGH